MPSTVESLGINRLPVGERIELAHAIWDTVHAELESIPLTDAQKREVDRRLVAHKENPTASLPFEEVEAAALARIGR